MSLVILGQARIDVPGLQAFLNGYQDLLQRVAAATLLGSVGFAAWLLRPPTIG